MKIEEVREKIKKIIQEQTKLGMSFQRGTVDLKTINDGTTKNIDQLLTLFQEGYTEGRKEVIEKVEEEVDFYDYFCEDDGCCYGIVQSGIREVLSKLKSKIINRS